MAKGEGQVFNICQESEATGRVFPSGLRAGAAVTAACLLRPPASNDVWSGSLRSLEKLNSVCWSRLASGSRTVKSAADWPRFRAAAQGQTPRESLKEPLTEPPLNRVENLDMCHCHNLQSCVLCNGDTTDTGDGIWVSPVPYFLCSSLFSMKISYCWFNMSKTSNNYRLGAEAPN